MGAQSRTGDIQSNLFGNTPWLKLMSSVKIKDIDAINNPNVKKLRIAEDGLAKKFILFNGTRGINWQSLEADEQRSGISRDTDLMNEVAFGNSAYGVGGNQFGIRPMPGVISANVQTLTNGTLKTATIQIKCWNKTQFDIIDMLYMRLGFTVLLEWGHTNYFLSPTHPKNNTGKPLFVPDDGSTLETEWFKGTKNYDTILEAIEINRLDSEGNYDAIFGKVVNFSWSFGKDGGYDITVIVRSVGDIIESLKMNKLDEGSKQPPSINENSTSSQIIKSYKDKNNIGALFSKAIDGFGDNIQKIGQSSFKDPLLVAQNFDQYGMKLIGNIINNQNNEFAAQVFQNYKIQYYIRLGSFLEWLETQNLFQIKNGNILTPPLKFDFDRDTNLIYTGNYFFPTNPRICIFHEKIVLDGTDYVMFPSLPNSFKTYKNNSYSRIMDLYINMEFILTTIDNLSQSNNNGDAYLIDLLKEICNGICNSTGNLNKLKPVIDETKNKLIIIDENQLPDRDDIISTDEFKELNSMLCRFNIYNFHNYGLNNQSSTFVRDFQMKTELSPEFASMITIGAAAGRNIISGEDASLLSKMNNGLQDRYNTEIINSNGLSGKAAGIAVGFNIGKEESNIKEKFSETYNNWAKFIQTIAFKTEDQKTIINAGGNFFFQPTWNEDNFNTYPIVQRTLAEYSISLNSLDKDSISYTTGFVPFNLSLTMDGLSGMKVFQKYSIDSGFLPSNYSSNLDFIIKTITNNITVGDWTTTIESIGIPNNVKGMNSNQTATPNSPPSSISNSQIVNGQLTEDQTLDFYKKILIKLNAPITENNLNFFKAWRQAEGGKAKYNPFNTTKSRPNTTNFNSVGVKNYSSFEEGVQATADSLKLSYYNQIVTGLRNNENAYQLASKATFPDLTTWGTRDGVKRVLQTKVIFIPIYY